MSDDEERVGPAPGTTFQLVFENAEFEERDGVRTLVNGDLKGIEYVGGADE